MTEVADRLTKLDRRISYIEAQRSVLQGRLKKLENDRGTLAHDIELTRKAEEALLHLSTALLGQSTGSIDEMVTRGLQAVFDDQSLEFRTVLTKMRGKTNAKFELLEDGQAAPILTSYGGGVLCVIGVFLRVMTVIVLGMRKVLFLDETMAHLSEEYIPNLSSFLRTLCDELEFEIVMVTHQPEFAANATVQYKAISKAGGLELERQE